MKYKVLGLQDVLLNCINDQESNGKVEELIAFYGADFTSKDTLLLHLKTMRERVKIAYPSNTLFTLQDIVKCCKEMSDGQRALVSNAITLVKLILVMPATNASSERHFSALRRLKSYTRSTMTQERLNHLLTLHIHKERTDSLDSIEVANDFVHDRAVEHRSSVFGKFKSSDIIKITATPS